MASVEGVFAAAGPLARAIQGYRVRPQQIAMAQAVAATIENRGRLIAEAGTGTGKTFAYLVPALLYGGKVIISTGTKTLQDQLFQRDIPTVRSALRVPVTVALLKGRANYVCWYHLERNRVDGRFATREAALHLARVARFAHTSTTGDRGELAEVPEDSPVWPLVTSTRENCLGGECPRFQECFVMEARKRALAADVVVVNHHLFFADVVLRDEGASELLPACNTVILDEAHQLPETATLFFGQSVSTGQLVELARDTRIEAAAAAKDFAPLPEAASALERAARDLRLAVDAESGRKFAHEAEASEAFSACLGAAAEKLATLTNTLEFQADRSEGLHSCSLRAAALAETMQRWRESTDRALVRWVEVFPHGLALNATPLSVAEIFKRQLDSGARAWIFTSATLSVNGDFAHYRDALGLDDARAQSWDSPFDYPAQALLYVPERMPNPNTTGFTEAVVAAALPIIKASRGRAFVLFTSLRAMRHAHSMLHEAFERDGLDYPLLLQGEGSRSELLDRFRRLGCAVLVGSQSFWEGVDVRGEALSLVVIDRLPFQPPDDPVLSARIEKATAEGRNAFIEHQLPRAVISLKQGAGRLIRDEADRGVLMICDTRLVSRPYGSRIWKSLPPMTRTRSLGEVVEFFAKAEEPTVKSEEGSVGEREFTRR